MDYLKQKLLKCEPVYGTHVQMRDITVSDIFSNYDYDFIWVDTEHSAIDYATLLNHITVIEGKGKKAIVRCSMDDFNHTKRVLEMGPSGVIFPMINTREEAEKAIRSTYYPPKGNRGCGPQRANGYGKISLEENRAREENFIRIIQLETRAAIENLEEIIKVDGIDCFVFGAVDLSADLNDYNNVFGEITQNYIKKAISVLKKNNKSIGISTASCNIETLKFWRDLGINFISTGSDFNYLDFMARQTIATVKKL